MHKKAVCWLCLGLLFAVLAAGSPSWAGQMRITVHGNDRISAEVDSVPLRSVLAGISQKTGISVFVEQGLNGTVSTSFSGLTTEEAMKRILTGYSNSMIFSKKGNHIVLSEVKVFEKGHETSVSFERLNMSDSSVYASEKSSANTEGGGRQASSSDGDVPSSDLNASSTGASGAGNSKMVSSISQQHHIQMSRLRREMMSLRKDMAQMTDENEKAAARAKIAQKTAEIKILEDWNQARIQGVQRMERRIAGQK